MPKQIMFLNGEVHNDSIQSLVEELILLDGAEEELAPEDKTMVELYINSPGGDLVEANRLIDCFSIIQNPVTTIALGDACSAAFMILINGDKRKATKNAFGMFHLGYLMLPETAVDKLEATIKENTKDMQKMLNDLKENTNFSEKEMEKFKTGDHYFNAQEMLKYGIVDEIIGG